MLVLFIFKTLNWQVIAPHKCYTTSYLFTTYIYEFILVVDNWIEFNPQPELL